MIDLIINNGSSQKIVQGKIRMSQNHGEMHLKYGFTQYTQSVLTRPQVLSRRSLSNISLNELYKHI